MGQPRSSSSLETYWAKRHFSETPEPHGKKARHKGHGYAIQMHSARRLHYDLRLELDGVLKSWAITKGPSLDPSVKRLAVRTEDHPVDYIAFEGNIPEGHYGAGTVLLWDRGEWDPIGDPQEGLEKGKLTFELRGERLKGKWALVRFKGERDSKRENWLLIKERDRQADEAADPVEEYKTSVASGRNTEEVSAAPDNVWKSGKAERPKKPTRRNKISPRNLPHFVEPELATLVEKLPQGEQWLFEMKFDGYRALASVDDGNARIFTRNGLDWTGRYGLLPDALAELGLDRALIDGEIVVVDRQGRSNFSALQNTLKGKGGSLSFFAFDLLVENGKDIRKKPLVERKKRLKALLGSAGKKGPVFYTDHIERDGSEMLKTLCRRDFEGVIAKRADMPYRSGRGKSWLKIKCQKEQEFVIVGWSPSDRRRTFSSLLLAAHEDAKLIYAGRVGTGFSNADLKHLAGRFRKLARKTPSLEGNIPPAIRRSAHWLRPELVAQIGFAEFTREGVVRHARYLGLREDKPASTVTLEAPAPVEKVSNMPETESAPAIEGIVITHPDRVLFPEQGVTKIDLARYLQKAANLMLPHVEKRLLSLVRCPQGRQKKCFFQRHAGSSLPEGFREMTVEGSTKREAYLYLEGVEGLVSAAQMGVLEFHIWGSRIDDVNRPDRIVFDLDPDTSLPFEAVIEGAFRVRDVLEALELQSFAMLTGGKGVHVVAPLVRRHEWPIVKAFTRAVADRMTADDPDRYVANMSKVQRKDRIFIDYLRNDLSSTAIAPYSPRARKGAPVAWPIGWEDLGNARSAAMMTVETAFQKRRTDPWQDYGATRQSLKAASLRALDVDT